MEEDFWKLLVLLYEMLLQIRSGDITLKKKNHFSSKTNLTISLVIF